MSVLRPFWLVRIRAKKNELGNQKKNSAGIIEDQRCHFDCYP